MKTTAVCLVFVFGLVFSTPVHAQPLASPRLHFYSVGTFTHSTRLFTVSASDWQLQWRYNCRASGSKGNFIVDVMSRSGDDQGGGVNELGMGGHGTEYMHQGGTFYLVIDSGCAWAINVYASHGSWGPGAGGTTVMRSSGDGQHQTQFFTVPSEWQLRWSFNCRRFGGSGNFIVDIASRSGPTTMPGVNELTTTDSGIEYMHQGGKFYLSVNSECTWNIAVTK